MKASVPWAIAAFILFCRLRNPLPKPQAQRLINGIGPACASPPLRLGLVLLALSAAIWPLAFYDAREGFQRLQSRLLLADAMHNQPATCWTNRDGVWSASSARSGWV